MKEKNVIQKACGWIAQKIKLVLLFVFPVAGIIASFILGARLYETGQFNKPGATVRITGKCTTAFGDERTDLVQDQMVVSYNGKDRIKGTLRQTREFLDCDKNQVAIDLFGPLSDLNKPLIPIKEIAFHKPIVKKKEVKLDPLWKRYVNQDLLVTGRCKDEKGEFVAPFKEKVISITNVDVVENVSGRKELIFSGIREDRVALFCPESKISYKPVQTNESKFDLGTSEPEQISFVGQEVYLTAVCVPNIKYYRAKGTKPDRGFYDFINTLVRIDGEKIVMDEKSPQGYRAIALSGIVMDKSVKSVQNKDGTVKSTSFFGHRFLCDTEGGKLIDVVPKEQAKIKNESQTTRRE